MVSITSVIIFNILDNLVIVLSGTYFLAKAIDEMVFEIQESNYDDMDKISESYSVFVDQLGSVRTKMIIAFLQLEFALIAYFVYWGLMFYFKVQIT